MTPSYCQSCAIRNRAICSGLDDAELEQLNAIGRRRRLVPGERLLWEGDEAAVVANVIEGVLKLSTQTFDGKEQILGLAYSSDFLGRPFGQTTPYGVEALTDAHVCIFQRGDFDRVAIRVDNGPEYVSGALLQWAETNGIAIRHIQPGKPQQNAYIERYNRTVRHEWLGQYNFTTISEVQDHATHWLWTYNNERPNMGIRGITPAQKLKRQLETQIAA